MHYRPLGKTGISVSEIGLGCNRLGEAAMPDSHWVNLVHQAVDLGVTLFDSSESYGWGRSEEILGQAVGNRDDLVIATKVSRIQESNAKDFSAQRIIEQVEGSLRRLRRECIDIYQLHSPSLDDLQQFDWSEAMAKLQTQGKIRIAGVSINDAASGQWLLDQGVAQVFQVAYNLLAPEVGEALFATAEEKGVGLMVRVPMAQGILTGKFRPGQSVAEDHRAHRAGKAMEQRINDAEAFRQVADGAALPMSHFALRYALSSSAVSAVIPGARNREQLTSNAAASNGSGLGETILGQVAALQCHLQKP